MSHTLNPVAVSIVLVATLVGIGPVHSGSYYPRPLQYPFPSYVPTDYSNNPCAACGLSQCAIVLQDSPSVYNICVGGARIIRKCFPDELLDPRTFQCQNVNSSSIETTTTNSTSPVDDDVANTNRESNDASVSATNMNAIIEKLNALQDSLSSQQERHREDMVVLSKAINQGLGQANPPTAGAQSPLDGLAANDKDDDAVKEVVDKLDPGPGRRTHDSRLRQLQAMLNLFGLGSTDRAEPSSDRDQADENDPQQREMRRRIMKMLMSK